ncbi:MAG: glycerophosphoryl diester phosphodiesterase membrane domain-containing protein [Lapillicoccus sp.]
MSGFGPPPGAPLDEARHRPPAYLPPGGIASSPPTYGGNGVGGGPQRVLLTTSHKPGIISLRPMSLGDLVDGAVKHIRRNPGAVLGASVIVLAASAVPAILLAAAGARGSWYADLGVQSVVDQSAFFALVLMFGVGFASLVLGGAMAYSVGEAALGRRPGLSEMWRAVRPRFWALVGLAALLTLAYAVPVLLLVLLLSLATATGSTLAAVLVGLIGGPAVAAWAVLLTARLALAGAAVVLERRGPVQALTRSWALTRRAFWRCLLRLVVVGLLATLVFWVVQLPLIALSSLVVAVVSLSPSLEALVSSLGLAVATLLSAAVVVPFGAGATSLLYVDQRMRTEGFDLVLQRAASRTPGGGG